MIFLSRFQIGFRNVLRNRRRTALNVLMIAGGIMAIVIFRGLAHNILQQLQNITIQSQYGHLQIASDKTWNPRAGETPEDRAFAPDSKLMDSVSALPAVDFISPRNSFYGLLNDGVQSISVMGIGLDPGREHQFLENLPITSGRNFDKSPGFQIVIGAGLQTQLDVKVGKSLTILTYTYDGSVNAIDAEVIGIFKTGFVELDNTTFYAPISLVHKLLDTDLVERFIVLLKSTDATDATNLAIKKVLPPGLESRTWVELSLYYRQIASYSKFIQNFADSILFSLVLLAIASTVGMSISERTGEIGTVRAIGDTQTDVFVQFLSEGLILGIIGGACGCVLGVIGSHFLSALKIPIDIPGSVGAMPIQIDFVLTAYVGSFIASCFVAIAATLIPAYRASKMNIVGALRQNI